MSLVFWGRRRVVMLLFLCCRLGACPAPGRLLGCGWGRCPALGDCPLLDAGKNYRWHVQWGRRLVGISLMIWPLVTGTAQVEGEQTSTP